MAPNGPGDPAAGVCNRSLSSADTNYHSNHRQKARTKEDGGPRTGTQTGDGGGDGDGGMGEERRVVKAAEQRDKKRVRELEDKVTVRTSKDRSFLAQ